MLLERQKNLFRKYSQISKCILEFSINQTALNKATSAHRHGNWMQVVHPGAFV